MRFKGALNCSLDGKALRGGKPLGKSLGFLREIDHPDNLAQRAVKAQKFLGYDFNQNLQRNNSAADSRDIVCALTLSLRPISGQASPRPRRAA